MSYHLYVTLICPWASRTLIARAHGQIRVSRGGNVSGRPSRVALSGS